MTDDAVGPEAERQLKILWTTQGARFAAQHRMMAMHRWSLGAIAAGSLYVCTVSFLPYFMELSAADARMAGLVSILSALGILVLSLLEAGQKYEVKAVHLHRCGVDLGRLRTRLDLFIAGGCPGGMSQLAALCSEYDEIIERCPENHHGVDNARFRASERKEFSWSRSQAAWANTRYLAYVYWRFVLIIVLPPAVAWYALA